MCWLPPLCALTDVDWMAVGLAGPGTVGPPWRRGGAVWFHPFHNNFLSAVSLLPATFLPAPAG